MKRNPKQRDCDVGNEREKDKQDIAWLMTVAQLNTIMAGLEDLINDSPDDEEIDGSLTEIHALLGKVQADIVESKLK